MRQNKQTNKKRQLRMKGNLDVSLFSGLVRLSDYALPSVLPSISSFILAAVFSLCENIGTVIERQFLCWEELLRCAGF